MADPGLCGERCLLGAALAAALLGLAGIGITAAWGRAVCSWRPSKVSISNINGFNLIKPSQNHQLKKEQL